MTEETAIKKQIKDWLDIAGWFHWPVIQDFSHARGLAGVPDITAVKDGIVIFIEVKSKKGVLSKAQKKFQKDLEFHGGIYIIARGYEDIETALFK